jgi:hypothetical protein
MNVSHLLARHHSLPSIMKRKERERINERGEEEEGKREEKE